MKASTASIALVASALLVPALALPVDFQYETRDLSTIAAEGLELRAPELAYELTKRDLEDTEDFFAREELDEIFTREELEELAELQAREPFGFLKLFKIAKKAGSAISHAVSAKRNHNKNKRRDLEDLEALLERAMEQDELD
ncbi:hypothetical protein DFP72DRAFT_895184 [Ephemerocybe angulata]|uniref:Uncharacterized protein n=1 Tax=Ephemerocybe angulata TaxID=980116 RepID=A0A8H6M4W5_9AGAR|nr:hypothetical protein DFP72DRAFT_895184 [Tulosesus angulatus]